MEPIQYIPVPRKEYKTITVKQQTFTRFLKAVRDAKKSNPDLDNSSFLEKLLESHRKRG
ncbi:MAG TPA: hypothetical protein VJ792_00985 [Candidatus Nitrosotalea sp.]|nr:hypothetical protein [Candidatus Nitrosotalea sp.]